MAREGFRTLVVAKKILTEDQYQDFEVWLSLILCLLSYHMNVRNFFTNYNGGGL